MVEAVETMDGWYTLHNLFTIDWKKWKQAPALERETAIKEFTDLVSTWDEVEQEENGSHGVYHILGQKADVMIILLRPSMEELADAETALNKSTLSDYLVPSYSHISVVELAKYRDRKDGKDPESLPETQKRLKPILPKWDHVSFYPMSRKRDGDDNWYTLEKHERGRLLYEHSKTGRKYSGKVKQIITGSIGFDDWEWGVTLFAHDSIELKKVVYEMRFDTATSRYGEFGAFFVGNILPTEKLNTLLGL